MSQILTVEQLCEYLKVGRKFIYLCRQMGMPYIKLGSKLVRYDSDEVENWLRTYRQIDYGSKVDDKTGVNRSVKH